MTRDDLIAALTHDNVVAFLRVIREGESNQNEDAYTLLYGGSHFDGFAAHPNVRFALPGRKFTTAAGAYQITETTWSALVKQFGFADFSPHNQDLAAVALIAGRHALDDVLAGRVDASVRRLPQEWTSLALPKRQAQAAEIFEAYGGKVAPTAQPVPAAVPKSEVKTVAPLVIPILSALSSLIPQLGSLFGGSEVAQRNVAAATIVAQKLTDVTQSVNLQEAAEKIQSDPNVLQAAKDAVAQIWPEITEVGDGVAGARKANLAAEQPPPWKDKAVIISVIFVPLIYIVVLASIGKWEYIGDITSETRAQVIGTVLGVLFGGIVGYFFGTSAGSQRKTDILGAKQ